MLNKTSPRRLRAKYTHRTKLKFYALCISPLQGALYHSFGQSTAAMIQKKTARCFLRCPSAYAAETAATDLSVAKRVCPSREEGVYGKTFIYKDVEATQCQGKNIVYLRPQAAGIPLRHLLHKGRYDLLERSGEGVSGRIQTLRDRGKMYRGAGINHPGSKNPRS